jgi:rubrerythrin
MEMSVADLVAYLENDLADFYARIKALPRLKEAQDILQQMETQCRQHAQRATEISHRYAVPGGVQFGGIIESQNRLKQAVSDAVVQEPDAAVVYRRLADAEETFALLYRRIAAHIRTLGATHAPIAETFDQLAAEELLHREAFLTVSETRPSG